MFGGDKKYNGKGLEMNYLKEIRAELVNQDETDLVVKIRLKTKGGSQEHEVVILLPKPRISHRARHLWSERPWEVAKG